MVLRAKGLLGLLLAWSLLVGQARVQSCGVPQVPTTLDIGPLVFCSVTLDNLDNMCFILNCIIIAIIGIIKSLLFTCFHL